MGRDVRQSIATKWQLGKKQKTVSSSQRGHVSQKDLDRANKYIENVRGLGRNWAIQCASHCRMFSCGTWTEADPMSILHDVILHSVKKLESKYPKNVIKVYHELQVDVQEANRKKAEKKQGRSAKYLEPPEAVA